MKKKKKKIDPMVGKDIIRATFIFWKWLEEGTKDPSNWVPFIKALNDTDLQRFIFDFEYVSGKLHKEALREEIFSRNPLWSDDHVVEVIHWCIFQGRDFCDEVYADINNLPPDSEIDLSAPYIYNWSKVVAEWSDRGYILPRAEDDPDYADVRMKT